MASHINTANMSGGRFFIHETSEKTIENNVLIDLSNFIHRHLHRQVTIISPTQRQERTLGFDDIIADLPPGITLALQFKRPYPYESGRFSNFAKFVIDTSQLQILLSRFNIDEAFYVFVPLPTTHEVIRNRANLLNIGVSLDVHNVPNPTKTSQKTRVARVAKSSLTPFIQIADPRKFESAKGKSLKEWCLAVENRDFFKQFESARGKKDVPLKIKDLYFVHISAKNYHLEL